MSTIKVALGEKSYPVLIGIGMTDKLVTLTKKRVGKGRLFVFFDAGFYALHGVELSKRLARAAKTAEFVVPSGEKSKSASVLDKLRDFLLAEKISRDDFILACGGGVTSDLVGYAAASTLRGIRWGVVSTTLLGMVDAAIGGKTGINHRRGKNLIGAFWQPEFVVCDTRYLMTLPRREIVAGLGEVAKYGGLVGGQMIETIERLLNKSDLYDERLLQKLISLSARCKAEIVAADERDHGRRMVLNFGHTVAHAIEASLGYGRLRHGEAVILGMLAALNMPVAGAGRAKKQIEAYRAIIERMVSYIPYRKINIDRVMEAVTVDKKRAGTRLRLVLLKRPGAPVIVEGVTISAVKKATGRMLGFYNAFGGKNA